MDRHSIDTSLNLNHNDHNMWRNFEDTTYKQLLNYAQNDLFKGQELTDLTPSFDCSCTN
jgi:hypothetical protein